MGEPATEMDVMDSAKASRGLDLGLKKAMVSNLDGLRWRPLFRSQLWTLWMQDSFKVTWCASIEEFVPIDSWVSSGKENKVAGFWQVRIYDIGDETCVSRINSCNSDSAISGVFRFSKRGSKFSLAISAYTKGAKPCFSIFPYGRKNVVCQRGVMAQWPP